MKVILSTAVSADGYMDDCTDTPLSLSSEEDWKDVRALRGWCDAILVGAGTLRADDPSLRIKDSAERHKRMDRGQKPNIMRVTLTQRGYLDPGLRFFEENGAERIVLAPEDADVSSIEGYATVIRAKEVTPKVIAAELSALGVDLLMVEGGAHVAAMFLDAGMVDEMRLAVAPVKINNKKAPKLAYFDKLSTGRMPGATLLSRQKFGTTNVSWLEFRGDRYMLRRAIALSRRCEPSQTSYCVGALLLTRSGDLYEGFTHETQAANHAEEEAIHKALSAEVDLKGATLYTSMEPCSQRKSKPGSCSQLIIEHGIGKVVYAAAEPDLFVQADGVGMLARAGVEVVQFTDMEREALAVNAHLLPK